MSKVTDEHVIRQLAESAEQTCDCFQWERKLLEAPIPLELRKTLIERSLEELQRRNVLYDLPASCSLERQNERVYSVSLSEWIVFLDTKSGEPEVYHALPLSIWNG